MNNITLLAILLIYSSSSWAQDINSIAAQYIKYYTSGELENASKLMACPENYSEKELASDRKANLESLKIFEAEFGKVIKSSQSNSSLYVTAMTACGTMTFLKQNTPFRNIIFDVTYENNINGYIVLGFGNSNDITKLVTVSHGLSATDAWSKEKVAKVIEMLVSK